MNRLKVRSQIAFLTAFLCVIVCDASLHAQALRARVSVKLILDAEGNRPIEEGFINTDLQVESHIAAANEALETSGADWRLALVEILDLAGVSQWYNSDDVPNLRNALDSAARADPETYAWRDDAINIYVIDSNGGNWGWCSTPEGSHEITVLSNQIWLKSERYRDEMALLISENPPEHLSYFIGTGLWLHEIGHYFNLHHTQGADCLSCGEGQFGECHTVPGDDSVGDTIPELECWDPDAIAMFNFGINYDQANAHQQLQVDLVWKNVMSYHNPGIFNDREAFFTPGQLERMAREMDPDTGRRLQVLETVLFPEFTLSAQTVEVGQAVLLDAAGSRAEDGHALVDWEWDFGDGSQEKGENVAHTYSEAGLYTVQLTITDDRGLRTTITKDVVVLSGDADIAPWVSADIGDTGYTGAARLDDGDLLIAAGGKAGADNFHFVYQEFNGDTVITARVAELQPDQAVSAVGLMLRESLDPGSKHASIFFNQSSAETNMKFIRKRGLLTQTTTSAEIPDTWVRIERQGDEFIGYHSDNGILWTELDRETIELPEVIFGGVAVTAINTAGNEVVLAEIANLYIGAPPDPRYIRGDGNGDGRVNIADPSYIAGVIFGLSVAPITCEAAADANGDGAVNIADPTYIANFLFGIGPAAAPPAPFPDCALVPPEEPLGCLGTSGCLE